MQLPAWLPLEAWTEYLSMRKQKKMVTTPRAEKMLLNKLEAFYEEGYDPTYIIDEALTGNWKSFFVNGGTRRIERPQAERQASERALEVRKQLDALYAKRAEQAKKGLFV